ncbi:hypothetical protein [Saccharicrinis aurantiacus]|uniref:hypothetical protein n=1 Tax=Saccharicrinis aurantiacus TaxID=1849719 RepID=UPI002493160D|nr:hypothetical protein [Saccharicrinis aurantiacus]
MNEFIEWIKCIFSIDNNTTATILITVFVFLMGLFFQGIFVMIKNIILRKRQRNTFIYLLNVTSQSIYRQGLFFEKFSKKLDIKFSGNFTLSQVSITYLSTFEKLEFELLRSSFINGIENLCSSYKLNAFTKSYTIIERIKKIEDSYPGDLNNLYNKFGNYEAKWNKSLELIRQNYDEILDQVRINNTVRNELEREFVDKLDQTIFKWQQTKNRNSIYTVQNELVIPLLALFKEQRYIQITANLRTLKTQLLNAEIYYMNLENIINLYKGQFDSYASIYKNTRRIINLIIKRLK